MRFIALAAIAIALSGCGSGAEVMQASQPAPVATVPPSIPIPDPMPATDPIPPKAPEPMPDPIPDPIADPMPQPDPGPDPEPKTGPVVFMGDSITDFWEDAPGINVGISGQITSEMLARFQRDVLDQHPSVVVILGGTNDIFRDMTSTYDLAQMADMAASANACVIMGLIPPFFFIDFPYEIATVAAHKQWNKEIREFSAAQGYLVADYRTPMEGRPELFYDGLHPNLAGYEVIRGVVVPLIEECKRR